MLMLVKHILEILSLLWKPDNPYCHKISYSDRAHTLPNKSPLDGVTNRKLFYKWPAIIS